MSAPLASAWGLDPGVAYLNHGSFGACPRAVLEHQRALQAELEREPIDFLVKSLPARLAAARASLAADDTPAGRAILARITAARAERAAPPRR